MNAFGIIFVVIPVVLTLGGIGSCAIGASMSDGGGFIGVGVVLLLIGGLLGGLRAKLDEWANASGHTVRRGGDDYFLEASSGTTLMTTSHRPRTAGDPVAIGGASWVIVDGRIDDDGDYIWIVRPG